MPTSNEDLQAKKDRVEKLREQVASEEAKRLEREQALANDVTAAQLDAEAARLEAQLETAKQSNKAAAVKEGASDLLDAANDDKARAESQRDAAIKAADNSSTDK